MPLPPASSNRRRNRISESMSTSPPGDSGVQIGGTTPPWQRSRDAEVMRSASVLIPAILTTDQATSHPQIARDDHVLTDVRLLPLLQADHRHRVERSQL